MKLNEYAQAVHENAVAHGWYDDGIEFPYNLGRPYRHGGKKA